MSKKIKYSPEYIRYLASGESAAVFITRDIVKSINTNGKWIDVVEMENRKNYSGEWDFKKIVVEIFPRKTHPVYPPKASLDIKRYITWETAHKDIEKQRAQGVKGIKFIIIPKLVNLNENKYKEVDALWDIKLQQFVDRKWKNYPCEIRKQRIYLEPKWDYKILSIKKL